MEGCLAYLVDIGISGYSYGKRMCCLGKVLHRIMKQIVVETGQIVKEGLPSKLIFTLPRSFVKLGPIKVVR